MKGLFLIFCVCVLRSQAVPFRRVANGKVATNAQHACMVLVIRPNLVGTNSAALGSGSIVSTRHVLTAASVVIGQNNIFQINFFAGTSRRTFQSRFALSHENYDQENHANDIALIFLQGDNFFPVLNIIGISTTNAQAGLVGTLTGYGFTSRQASGQVGYASTEPMSGNQTVSNTCVFEDFEATPSHFCALDPTTSAIIICPGDNGEYILIFKNCLLTFESLQVEDCIFKIVQPVKMSWYEY